MLRTAQSGFTLLELMVVIAIIATITGMAIPSFNNYITSQNLRQSQDQIKSDIRGIQIRALNGVKQNIVSPTFWGIFFLNGQSRYAYFVTDVPAPQLNNLCNNILANSWDDLEKSEILTAEIEAKNNACFFFSFEDGDAVCRSANNVGVGYPDTGATHYVAVNRAGTVYTYTGNNTIPAGERCPTN